MSKHVGISVAGALVASIFAFSPALAEERICRGALGPVVVDNLRVPQGASCRLDRTRVKGTIKVQRGATLDATRVVVIGNVQAEGAKSVAVRLGSRIGGSVQIDQGGGGTFANSSIDGSIQLKTNRTRLVVSNNSVGSDVQAFSNSGGVVIENNRIDGNLQCKSNRPAPTGGRNTVQGNKEDQCRRL